MLLITAPFVSVTAVSAGMFLTALLSPVIVL